MASSATSERFGKLEPADVKRPRQLEHENAKLKKLSAISRSMSLRLSTHSSVSSP
jgi:hypothetical protein